MNQVENEQVKRRCVSCDRKKDIKTRNSCASCDLFYCNNHMARKKFTCINCIGDDFY